MNEPEDSMSSPNDEALDEMLGALKRLEPPLEARLANREAVANELQNLLAARCNRSLPWRRRWVSFPAPIAASFLALAAWGALSLVLGIFVGPVPLAPANSSPQRAAERPAVPEHYQTETYLCGIGRVRTESGYLSRSNGHE